MNMEVKELGYGNHATICKRFKAGEYEVNLKVGDGYLESVSVYYDGDDSTFVFDFTREDHLQLAHHIYLKVCEARKEAEQVSTKVSGKGK